MPFDGCSRTSVSPPERGREVSRTWPLIGGFMRILEAGRENRFGVVRKCGIPEKSQRAHAASAQEYSLMRCFILGVAIVPRP